MWPILYKYLISHGLTNLVEIDGLVYAPINDLVNSLVCCAAKFLGAVAAAALIAFCISWAIDFFRDHPPFGG